MTVRDFLGRDIRINDNVVWPAQSGHRLSMRRGQVVKINPSGSLTVKMPNSFIVSVRRVDNVVVIL